MISKIKYIEKHRIILELALSVLVALGLFFSASEVIHGFYKLDSLSKIILISFGFKAIFESVEVFFSTLLKTDPPMVHVIDGIISFLLVKLIMVVVLKDIDNIIVLAIVISIVFIWRIMTIKYPNEEYSFEEK